MTIFLESGGLPSDYSEQFDDMRARTFQVTPGSENYQSVIQRNLDNRKALNTLTEEQNKGVSFNELFEAHWNNSTIFGSMIDMKYKQYNPPEDGFDEDAMFNTVKENVDPKYWDAFVGVKSGREYQQRLSQLQRELDREDVIRRGTGGKNLLAAGIAGIIDPIGWVVGGVGTLKTGSAIARAGWATKASQVAAASAGGASSALASEALIDANKYTHDGNAYLAGALLGASLGGISGGLTKVPNINEDNIKASMKNMSSDLGDIAEQKVKTKLDTEVTAEDELNVSRGNYEDNKGSGRQSTEWSTSKTDTGTNTSDNVDTNPEQDTSVGAAQVSNVKVEKLNVGNMSEFTKYKYGEENVDVTQFKPHEKVMYDADNAPKEFYEDLERYKDTKSYKTMDALSKVGLVEDAFVLYNSKSQLANYLGGELLASGSGLGSRKVTVSEIAENNANVYQSEWAGSYYSARKEFQKRRGNGGVLSAVKTDFVDNNIEFDKQLRLELERRRLNQHLKITDNTTKVDPAIKAVADSIDEANKNLLKNASEHLTDFEEIVGTVGHVPLRWLPDRFLNAVGQGRDSIYRNLMVEAYKDMMPELEDSVIQNITEAVWSRNKSRGVDFTEDPTTLLGDGRSRLEKYLKDANLPSDVVKDTMDKITRWSDGRGGRSSYSAKRTPINLSRSVEVNGVTYSLLDLVDNDIGSLLTKYGQELSGRSAISRKLGIKSDTEWEELVKATVEDAVSYDVKDAKKISKILQLSYNSILGRPESLSGGDIKGLRRMREFTNLAFLGKLGIAEMGNIAQNIGEMGADYTMAITPELKNIRKFITTEKLTDPTNKSLLEDLESIAGLIGQSHNLTPYSFRPDEMPAGLGNSKEIFSRADALLARGQEALGYISGFNHISSLNQQLTSVAAAGKFFNRLRDIDSLEEADFSRIYDDFGFSKEEFIQLSKYTQKYVSRDADGRLKNIDFDKWGSTEEGLRDREKFILGINRVLRRTDGKTISGESSYWMSSTVGRMLLQFRRHPLQAINKQVIRNTKFADPQAFVAFSSMLAGGLTVHMARTAIGSLGKTGEDREKYLDKALSTSGMFKGVVGYSNATPLVPETISIASMMGLAPKSWNMGSFGRAGMYKEFDLTASAIAPGLTAPLNLLNAASTGVKTVTGQRSPRAGDWYTLQSTLPFGNTVPATVLFNLARSASQ